MFNFLIDNICVTLGGCCFLETIGVSPFPFKQTVPLLGHLILYSYSADLTQELLRKREKMSAVSLNFIFSFKDDNLSINNSKVGEYAERIYPIELKS